MSSAHIEIDPEKLAQFKTDPLLQGLPHQLLQYVELPDSEDNVERLFVKNTNTIGPCWGGMMSLVTLGYAGRKFKMVLEGDIGLAWHGQTAVIYGPGRHYLLNTDHWFVGKKTLAREKHIQHGIIHIINVALGELGIGNDSATGLPVILASGQHIFNSTAFQFDRFSKLLDTKNIIGEMTLIRVELGDIGYGFHADGSIMILPAGFHLITPPARYQGNLSMQLQIVDLPPSVNESKDYVQIEVQADVYYKIQDPLTVLTNIGGDILKEQIKELGVSTLQQIIRSSTLADIAGSDKANFNDDQTGQSTGEPDDFYEKVHDKFLTIVHKHVLKEWGVNISNIRIENLRIHDRQLAQSIAQSAIQVSQLEAEHMMLDKQTKIITVRASNKAKQIEFDVNAEADKLKRLAQAEAESTLITAKAQQDAKIYDHNTLRRLAEAEAEATLVTAKAEKDAKILQGEGEAEYSRLVQESGLGATLATLSIHKEAMKGVEQIVYVPHLPHMMGKGSPLFDSAILMPEPNRKKLSVR